MQFYSGGAEAVEAALRMARSYTGRFEVISFWGGFHGKTGTALGLSGPDVKQGLGPLQPGVHNVPYPDWARPPFPAHDPDELGRRCIDFLQSYIKNSTAGSLAAIIVEPSGASWATIPLADGYLAKLRELATAYGAVLIFDEVITGFRWSPGGAQQKLGVIPDMTTMAKIVAGGLPGGAVGGKTEIMDHLVFKDEAAWNAKKKIGHPGTFNANPLTAAAGVACLIKCADPAVQAHCDALAARVRIGFNTVLENHAILGASWGESSIFHVIVGEEVSNRIAGDLREPDGISATNLKVSGHSGVNGALHAAMQLEGIDLFHGGGLLSTAHTENDVDFTIDAFDRALGRLKLDGVLI